MAVEPLNTERKQKLPAWVLYTALGGGNLMLSLLAFWAYRLVMRRGEQADVDPNTNPDMDPGLNQKEPHAVDLLEEPIGPIEIDLDPEVSSEDTSGDSGVDSLLAEFEQNWNDDTAGSDPTNQPDK